MGDLGILCTICGGLDHRASSCPKRKRFRAGPSAVGDQGRYLVRALFQENNPDSPLYTLKDYDTDVPSLKRLYLECEDPSEYEFANKHLGGWDHWQEIATAAWFQPFLTKWRKELELKLKAEAFQALLIEARSGTKNSFSANRFLLAWNEKDTSQHVRGRPSKAEIQAEAMRMAENQDNVDADFKRLNLN